MSSRNNECVGLRALRIMQHYPGQCQKDRIEHETAVTATACLPGLCMQARAFLCACLSVCLLACLSVRASGYVFLPVCLLHESRHAKSQRFVRTSFCQLCGRVVRHNMQSPCCLEKLVDVRGRRGIGLQNMGLGRVLAWLLAPFSSAR